MPSPVICIRDTAIQNGQLMVKDMWPNRSQANPVADPAPQGPRYLRITEATTLPVLNGTVVARAVSGLAAYLLVTLDLQANGDSMTPAGAKLAADALVAEMRAGSALTLNDMNTAIQAADATLNATGIVGTGASTATVNNILQILSGATFTVAAGYDLEDVNNAVQYLSEADQASGYNAFYNPIVFEDSSFWISVAQGDLLLMKSTRTVNGANQDPYVVVYDGTGNVL